MITTLQTFEHGRLDYDATVPCIVGVMLGFMDSHEFRLWLNEGLKLLIEKKKEHGKIMWLADGQEMDSVALEDINWVNEDWTPRALKEGIRHVAFVRPKDEIADMSMTTYEELANDKIIIANFHDLEAAKNWFRNIIT